jgi:hypothetical protein
MLTSNDIRNRLSQRPFLPVRIVTSSGESYTVTHPDLVLVGRREITIGIATPQYPTDYEQLARVSILHITALEDLPISAPSGGNGQH